ncbi:MAG: pitrilysin family protein [Firmicutes bacterium]|nr:pitrilysin family protein [Bacillota bacterium]
MIRVEKLKCGTTVILEKTDFVQSTAFGIWVKSGAMYEDDSVYGVSHYIEHMMFKGTKLRNAREIAEQVDNIGGVFNAFTGKEATCYYIKTLASNIYKGAEILIDMVTSSVFDQDEMDKERQVILEEIKMVKDTPDDDVYDTISELVNSGNALKNNILGSPESLAGINRDKMVDYYRTRYVTENLVVAVSGSFDEDEMIKYLEGKFDALGKIAPKDSYEMKPYVPKFDVKVKDIEQTHICLAVPSVSLDDDQYYTHVLMSNILGGSMSSRLFQTIREEKGLAYTVCSMNSFNSFTGFFSIYAGVAHENIGQTIEEIRNELNLFAEKGVTEEELERAREQVKSSYIFGLESVNSRMFGLGKNRLLLGKNYTAEEVLGGFDSVTSEDILKVAEMVGDITKYSGAAVTGAAFDLEGMIK